MILPEINLAGPIFLCKDMLPSGQKEDHATVLRLKEFLRVLAEPWAPGVEMGRRIMSYTIVDNPIILIPILSQEPAGRALGVPSPHPVPAKS